MFSKEVSLSWEYEDAYRLVKQNSNGMQTITPTIMRGVQQQKASDLTSVIKQSPVLDEVGNRILVDQVMGFCFYSRSFGTLLKGYWWDTDMLRFVF